MTNWEKMSGVGSDFSVGKDSSSISRPRPSCEAVVSTLGSLLVWFFEADVDVSGMFASGFVVCFSEIGSGVLNTTEVEVMVSIVGAAVVPVGIVSLRISSAPGLRVVVGKSSVSSSPELSPDSGAL